MGAPNVDTVAPGSTSLVDRSAASDFVSLALGLVPIGRNTGGAGGNKPALTSMTSSPAERSTMASAFDSGSFVMMSVVGPPS